MTIVTITNHTHLVLMLLTYVCVPAYHVCVCVRVFNVYDSATEKTLKKLLRKVINHDLP